MIEKWKLFITLSIKQQVEAQMFKAKKRFIFIEMSLKTWVYFIVRCRWNKVKTRGLPFLFNVKLSYRVDTQAPNILSLGSQSKL